MNPLRFFVYAALLLLLNNVDAGPGYQRTRDGKTLVWNNRPTPGDAVTWSGKRDADGYATGHGTLTWFMRNRGVITGSRVPVNKYREVTSYSGNMVRGKLDGAVVNVDANGRRFHGTFVNGKKSNDWSTGRAEKGRATEAEPVEAPAEEPSIAQQPENPQPAAPSPPPPATVSAVADSQHAIAEPPSEGPAIPKDDSLRVLTAPPRSLRANVSTAPAPEASIPQMSSAALSPRLTASEVINLADAEARIHGYDLNEYPRPQTQYRPADEAWSVFYSKQSGDGTVGKHFNVSVEDKTKKTSFTADR